MVSLREVYAKTLNFPQYIYEVTDMKIKDTDTLQAFEKAIDKCEEAVFLLTPDGQQFNLKNPMEKYEGIGRLLEDEDEQMELFTNDGQDEAVLFDFFRQYQAA